jgi:hypothetical protein
MQQDAETPTGARLVLALVPGGTVRAVPPAPPAWGWRVREYVLMEATGRPEARYRVLQRFDDRSQDDGAAD